MKKCKCSFEIQTRAANLHIPSSDKNQKVSINARWDRGKTRMWAKASRGDDGSQFSRKRSGRPCGLNSKGLSLCFCELNYTGYEPEFNFEDVSHCAMWARLKPLYIPLNAPWKLSYMIISPYVFIWQNLFYCTKKSPHLWGFCLI